MGMKIYLAVAATICFAGMAHAISDEGWFCPPGTELYQGQCWAPTQPEQPRGDVTATGGKAVSGSHSASTAISGSTSGAQANNAVNIRNKQSAASAIAP